MGKIFEDRGGAEYLVPSLKTQLQQYEVDSHEAHLAVAGELSKGSKGVVPKDDKVVQFDLDMISLKTTENPNLLF